ncbi:uncharacterized protein LOC141686723 [Apium graveolens]|uniref:uncharacterized protein LOC141686723 n=1 Tax=Apium graveolens TaxID=4045 RepID=UPI003D7BA73B
MVVSYGQMEKRSNGAEKLDIVVINEKHEKIIVTLWEERAIQLHTSLTEIKDSAMFIVITGLLAKKNSDNASLSSTDATKTYFNIKYPPLLELKDKVATNAGKDIGSLCPPTIKQFVTMDDKTVLELPIQSILDLQIPPGNNLIRCLLQGKITGVLNGNGWYYNCCSTCARASG